MQRPLKDYLQLHFIILILGFTAILGTLISIHSVSTVFFRTSIATIGIYFFLKARKVDLSITSTAKVKLLAVGFLISLHWFLFFFAAKISTVAICLAGFSTGSLWTSFIEPFWYKRKIRIYEVILGLVVIGGLYLIFLSEVNHIWGLLLGMLAAMLSALFSVINSTLTQRYPSSLITFYEMMGAAITSFVPLVILALNHTLSLDMIIPQGLDWLWLAILSLVCTVYAFTATVDLLYKFSAFTFNLALNLEPIYGIVFAYCIFGEKEQMTQGFYWGAAIILASVLVYPLFSRLSQKKIA
jgi:drug/metabolite transporter (DMT)-like permease